MNIHYFNCFAFSQLCDGMLMIGILLLLLNSNSAWKQGLAKMVSNDTTLRAQN